MKKWWKELGEIPARLSALERCVEEGAIVEELADIRGAVKIGTGTKICRGAVIEGSVAIGRNCLIGNNSMVRGPAVIGDGVLIGFSVEVKNAIIEDSASIGPLCFVADSIVRKGAFLGALVRTSNFMLQKNSVKVLDEGELVSTGLEKLGACIGEDASLGIGVVILPGRAVAPKTVIGPHVIVEKNLKPGVYLLKQEVDEVIEGRIWMPDSLAKDLRRDALHDKILKFIDGIESEQLPVGEPAESVRIGRMQVCDELRQFLLHLNGI